MPMRSRAPAALPGKILEGRAWVALPEALPALPGEILEQRAQAALSRAPVVRRTPDRPRAI